MTKQLDGGCLCGRVRYRITEAPAFGIACHCTECQAATASAFSLGLVVAENGFALSEGEPKRWTREGSSSKPNHMFRCPDCGTWTHSAPEAEAGHIIVRPSALDEHGWFRPVVEIFTRDALPWARLATPFSYDTMFDDPAPLVDAWKRTALVPGDTGGSKVKAMLGLG